jgi:hypothetical protein
LLLGGVSFFSATADLLFRPGGSSGVTVFYAIWITIFLFVNIVWDIRSSNTGKFHIGHLSEKIDTLFSATTFASSLFLILAIFQDSLVSLAKDSQIPIFISGISGVLISLRYLCPYPIPTRQVPNKAQIEPAISLP